jgi:ClpP class serine protease
MAMNQIWACEKNFILDYQQRIINATAEEISAAEGLFDTVELPDILFIEGDTAIIKIEGVLSKNGPSPIARFFGFGGTGYDEIIESIEIIKADENIKNVILQMNTPGGGINGVDEVYIGIKNLGKSKTVTAENHGILASGGYWIASAASKIVAIGPAVETGSIGVIITAIDDTEWLKDMGLKRVRIVSQNAPKKAPDISKKSGLNILQDRVDALERIFIKRIADGRGVTEEHVREKFGRGAVMIADDPDETKDDALNVKMIDSVVNRIGKSLPSEGVDDDTIDDEEDDDENEDSKKHDDTHGLAAIHTPEPELSDYEKYIESLNNENTPAVAGENNIQEDTMTLIEIMSSDPAVKAEVEYLQSESKKAGVIEGRAVVEARVKAAMPYLSTDSEYPDTIKNMAAKVVSGEVSAESLVGTIAAYDAVMEKQKSDSAQGETETQGETGADTSSEAVDEVAAMVAEDSKKIGRV